jgi:parallel beta-helix repeat protein
MSFVIPLSGNLYKALSTKPSFALMLLGAFFLFSATNAYSNCGSGETIVWSENQIITGTFVVNADDVLEIMPGVVVQFQTESSGLQILGTIQAEGTAGNPIIFEGAGGNAWNGIDLDNACPSILTFCHFSGISRSVSKNEKTRNSGGFIISATGNVTIDNCLFEDNFDGIGIIDSEDISISNCTFQMNEISFSDNGLIYLEGASGVLVSNNSFFQNKVSMKGILNVTDGSNVIVLGNSFSNTTFAGALFFGSTYPVILVRTTALSTQAAINGNSFVNNRAPNNQKLAEVQLTGAENNIDLLTCLVWNNNFLGYPLPLPGATPKSALRASNAVVTISHNTFRFYNDYGVRILKSEAKINLNSFENNRSVMGALSFDNYTDYSGRPVENVVYANVFTNNRATQGAAVNCGNMNNNLVNTTIDQNIFTSNEALEKGGAINALAVSSLLIENNRFTQNTAATGGGVYAENSENVTLVRNLFSENSAVLGAGVFVKACDINMFNCNFVANASDIDGGALFLEVTSQNTVALQNCNFTDHGATGGITITGNSAPESIGIFNTLFYGNNSGSTGKAIVFSSAQDVVTSNCYFDVFPDIYSVENIDPQQAAWPGWQDAGIFYLDCENSVCVDNGNDDASFNDKPGSEPNQALFPSCGTLINDIGISGGPYAADRQWLFEVPVAKINQSDAHRDYKNSGAYTEAINPETKINADDIRVYPNPSTGNISISANLSLSDELMISLINMQGRKIFETSVKMDNSMWENHFDFSALPKGVYTMIIHSQNQSVSKKIILN